MIANTSQSDVDGYGFQRADNFDHKLHDSFMAEYLPIMTRRAMRWDRLIGNNESVGKSRKVKRFCRKGIPAAQRPMVWMCLSGAHARMKTNPSLYTQMLKGPHTEQLIETINMDIHRTFPDNLYFATAGDSKSLRKPLYNVLVAVAHKNQNLGYCQGMNFIAGLLLLILKNEEKVFWMMDTLFCNILPDYYNPNMVAVQIDQATLGEVVKWKAPDIASHMEKLGISWELVGMKWFICLFADVMPIDINTRGGASSVDLRIHNQREKYDPSISHTTVLRIWDCLFNEGSKILIRAALVLIISHREKILKCTDLSECLQLFNTIASSPATVQCHTFLKSMFDDVGSLPLAKITKLRSQCQAQVK